VGTTRTIRKLAQKSNKTFQLAIEQKLNRYKKWYSIGYYTEIFTGSRLVICYLQFTAAQFTTAQFTECNSLQKNKKSTRWILDWAANCRQTIHWTHSFLAGIVCITIDEYTEKFDTQGYSFCMEMVRVLKKKSENNICSQMHEVFDLNVTFEPN
jgi:hypothetical protein